MDKKYYWIIDGKYYEVSKETYQKYKREHDHSKRLQKYENEVVVLSLDAVTTGEHSLSEIISDTETNVENEAIQNVMIEKLKIALAGLSTEELSLINMLYSDLKSEREIAAILGISQKAVNKRKHRILERLKKFLEK